jgi:hypothetical protein
MKSLNPKRRRKMTLKQERADDIVESAKNAFSLAILLGSVRGGHAKHNPARAKKRAGGRIFKLTVIVTLNTFNGSSKLSGNN